MADTARPRPAQARPPKETVDERRKRQSATAAAAQVDLKREAAERRSRKTDS